MVFTADVLLHTPPGEWCRLAGITALMKAIHFTLSADSDL